MSEHGIYADGRVYPLPPSWAAVPQSTLESAAACALDALDADALTRVRDYYDPESAYAGDFLTASDGVAGNDPFQIDPADLFAVSTLNVPIHPRAARRLLRDGRLREDVAHKLQHVHPGLPITELDSEPNNEGKTLEALWEVHNAFRTASGERSNRWVFAAKLTARKRPYLAPVRDELVCKLLNRGAPLSGGLGTFRVDLQVFAYLMTLKPVANRVSHLRGELDAEGHGGRLEPSNLRLLDVALWTKAVGHQ